MSKIGLHSDFHLHLWKSFGRDPKTGLPVRFQEQINVQDQMVKTFIGEGCKLVIDGGDGIHLDSAIPIECINVRARFSRQLRKAGIKEEIAEGNHTLSKKVNPTWINRSYYSLLDDEDDAGSPSKDFIFEGAKIKLLGYSDETSVDDIKGYDLVVVHKQPDVTNRFGHHYAGVNWKTLAQNNRLVFFGHYHVNEKLSNNCYIIGPPMHLNFGDEGPRGVWTIDVATWTINFIKLDYPDFITVNTPEEVKDDKNYYRVLHAKTKIDSDRVITSVVPEFFEERIKSDDFVQILSEWCKLNGKEQDYLDVILPLAKLKAQTLKNVYKGEVVRVVINNFFSIDKAKYDVEKGFHIIVGKNEDFDSNGAGKTTLFEAIYWCFFGKTTKGSLRADEIIRDGEKDCEVEVWLLNDEEHPDGYVIKRTKKEGLKVFSADHSTNIWDDMTEGRTKPECEKMLFDVLGFDEKVYLASCYFSQENILMLTGLGDADRTNMITDLLGFDTYDDLHKQCGEFIKKFKTENIQIDDKLKTIVSDCKWIEQQADDIKKRIQDVDSQVSDKTIAIDNKTKEARVLGEQLISLQPPKVTLFDVDKKITEAEEGVKNATAQMSSLRSMSDELEGNKRELQKSETKSYSDYWSEQTKKDMVVASLKAVEGVHSHSSGQFCTSCGGKITKENSQAFIEDSKSKIKEHDENIIIFNGVHGRIKKQVENITKQIDEKTVSAREMQNSIDQRTIELREANSLKVQLQNQQKEYEVKKVSLDRQIESIKTIVQQLNSDMDRIKKSKDLLQSDLKSKEDKLIENQTSLLQLHNETENKKKLISIYEFWSEAFMPSGIRSVLLDRFCNEFNTILNQYLSLVSNGVMSIVVSPTKKTGGGLERNKIGITINNAGIERNYLALSGGEKRRVDVSLCLGLNRWVSVKYCLQYGLLGIIILDELFSFIDRLGEEAIGGLLYEEGMKRAIFVISHTPDIGSYTRKVWTCIKEKGITRLEIEDSK